MNRRKGASTAAAPTKDSLDAPELYLNRELTWLAFNFRVLAEAADPRTPPLERLKFLAITGSNLDEFFMKRIGGLMQQMAADVTRRTVDGRTPAEQLDACHDVVLKMMAQQKEVLDRLLLTLKKKKLRIVRYDKLKGRERTALRERYIKNIFPLVTPHVMSPAHPFPFVSNLSLNLLVTLRYPDEDRTSLARVKVPVGAGIPRFMPVADDMRYVTLEDVIANNLDLLFPGMKVIACELFRVTRNANTETNEEEADDLLEMIESELRHRKIAPIVRLEVVRSMAPGRRAMLAYELELEEAHVYAIDGLLGYRDLWELALLHIPALRDAPHHPVENPLLLDTRDVFEAIRTRGPVLVHFPYESFDATVVRLLREAIEDPQVRAIKMTLYRTEPELVLLLAEAARNGKQVTVVIELKARFDEAANIKIVGRLEEAGISVTYGVVGVKTHCKVLLVVRQEMDGLRRYAHVGTGNYHPTTARIYSDVGLMTCDPVVGADLTELFNYLTTGYKPNRGYRKVLVAPKGLKKALLAKIDREIAHAKAGSTALIQMKMNALEDVDVVRALYRASQAGVKVDLIVRDTCRLRPGLPGFSETVTVVSIVGRFLEHSRVFYFHNGGQEEYYIGSADCMKRNLESRVEVLMPAEDRESRAELRFLLDTQLADTRNSYLMQPDGSYVRRSSGTKNGRARGSHDTLIAHAEKRLKQATRLKRRKPKGRGKSLG